MSLAVNLLTKCCGLKKGMAALRSDGEVIAKEDDRFMTLYNADWSDSMSCPASAAQKSNTYNKPDELPSMEDLVKLKQYSENRLEELTKQLQMEPSYPVWRALSETVLTRLFFNKCRGSEPAKLLLSEYINRPDWHQTSNRELLENLRPIEKILAKRTDLVQVPGKRNRRVPILILG